MSDQLYKFVCSILFHGGAAMTEAKHLHEELSHALQLLIPQTTRPGIFAA